jgi:ABC-type Fe3+/spermidine/putrescine transport system ATPase subunit
MSKMEAVSADTVLRFTGVNKAFGGARAVSDLSFSVRSGETLAILGPSGCGKTTTLRMIAGFEDPDTGAIEIGGASVIGLRPYERNVGLLFQNYALFPHMTVAENVAYGLKQRRWPRAQIASRVAEMLRLVHLQDFSDRRPRQLSGGQQQRVALARVLATKPGLVLLDEPLSALDAKLREELGAELKRILTEVGSTTIVVTHDQAEAMSLADRIIVMNRGGIAQEGTPTEIYSRPASRFVASFMGRNNWIGGTLRRSGRTGPATVVLDAGIVLNVGDVLPPDGAAVSVALRPERIAIGPDTGSDRMDEANQFPATVVSATGMGPETHYAVDCALGRLLVVAPGVRNLAHASGDRVRIGFRAEDCALFPADEPA